MIIAVDIGYGYTKGYTVYGGKEVAITFPSVVGNTETVRFENDMVGSGEGATLRLNNGPHYWFGELALLQSRVQTTLLNRSRAKDEHAKLLFIAALAELATKAPLSRDILHVVTGLPVNYYNEDSKPLEIQMVGMHHVDVDDIVLHFTVDQVVIVPQPFGALFATILNENGDITEEDLTRASVGVVDIGTYTTDLVVMRPDDQGRPTYIERESRSVPTGLSKALELTQRKIADTFGLDLSLHQIDHLLMTDNGQFRVKGQPHDIEPFARPHLYTIASSILAVIKELWGEGTHLDTILITGGGGEFFQEQITEAYSHARLVEAPFWGNVRGFYRYGLRPRTFR